MLNFVIAILCEALEEISKRKKEKEEKANKKESSHCQAKDYNGDFVEITINGTVRQIVGSAEEVNREDINDYFFELFDEVQHFKKLDKLNEQYIDTLVRMRERLANDVLNIKKMFMQR